MGSGSSVRLKVVGESKEFHGTLVSESSDCVEVYVHNGFSQFINVMFICNEWGSSKGGLSTFNREFAVNLAKKSSDKIKVHCYVCSSSEEEREDARNQEVNIITVRRVPGASDPMEWLKLPPPELPNPDIVVGHGRKFGGAAYFISKQTQCKWIQFVHVFCEDLGKHKLEGGAIADAIAENEEKNKRELELCEAADLVVAVGTELQQKYIRRIPEIKVITPGLFEKFHNIHGRKPQNAQKTKAFRVFMFGRGSFEDFALKGYDIVGKAVALLGRKFELTFVGSPHEKQREIETWFLEETKIARNQLTIRGYADYEEMKKMFCEADLIVMPSRTEGFGLVSLEAISAGIPVLVSGESGIAKALEEVEGGMSVVVNSDMPQDWAERIKQFSEQKPEDRYESAMKLRKQYGNTFSWKKECERFEQMIQELAQKSRKDAPIHCLLTDAVHVLPISSANKAANSNKGGVLPIVTVADQSLHNEVVEGNKVRDLPTDSKDSNSSETSSEYTEASSDKADDPTTVLVNNLVHKDKNKWNSLHSAARDGDVTKIKALLSHGFFINSRTSVGKTPLMIAAENDKIQAIHYFLQNGADPSLKDNEGWNLLHCASQGGNPVIIELVVGHVPSIDSENNRGITPLMAAARLGKVQAVKFLLEKGASPSLEDNSGWNSLHWASWGGNTAVIEKILFCGVDIESKGKEGSTPRMIAQRHGQAEASTYLSKFAKHFKKDK